MSSAKKVLLRTKASVTPSGEKAGKVSPTEVAGGEVSRRFSPVSTETRKMLDGSSGEIASGTARDFPSGDQARSSLVGKKRGWSIPPCTAQSLRSGPPRAGTMKTARSLPEKRKKAM